MRNRIFKGFSAFFLSLVFAISFFCDTSAQALTEEDAIFLEPIVVTATRIEVPAKEAASSVTIIDGKTIEAKHHRTVLEALRAVPGLDVSQTGGSGGATSVFLRGTNSNHTLVLIDGVQVNSPTLGQYNFANLTTDNIDRIEIIRGPQSTLYGSDAIGGVIQIFTKKGKGPLSASVSFEGGSFESFRETIHLSGATGHIDYALSSSRFDTKGFSRANETSGNIEDDGYENTTVSSRLGVHLAPRTRLDWTLHFSDAEVDLDNSFPVSDNLNAIQENETWSSALSFSSPVLENWDQKLQFLFQQEESKGSDPVILFNNFEINTQRRQIDWQNNITLSDFNILTAGYEYELQKGENVGTFDQSITNHAGYLLNQFRYAPVIVNLGIRFDDNNRFGDKTTFKTEAAYLFEGTKSKLRAAYGTGFHAPTLNDLFFPGFGNLNVKPEESESYEIGLEQAFIREAVHMSATYFHTEIDELIVFVVTDPITFIGQAENVQKAMIKGVEIAGDWTLSKHISLTANYTYTDTENVSTGADLARRPKSKASGTITIKLIDIFRLVLDIRYVGKRFNDTANMVSMSDYTVVNLAGTYQMTKYTQLFTRIENLFDREYEEVAGFGTAGFGAFGGVKVTF